MSPLVGQVIASVTGLASGETEPVGWPRALVLAALAIYALAVAAMGVGGLSLLRDLFKTPLRAWLPLSATADRVERLRARAT